MLQAVGQLLRAGYLETIEGWPLNYVSLQLTISAHRLTHRALSRPLSALEEKAVERTSVEVLHEAVTSAGGAGRELWSRLLDLLLRPHYGRLAGPLCRALALLAERRWQWAPRRLTPAQEGSSPTPQELMARLLGLAVSPWAGSGRGAPALLLLSLLRTEMDAKAAAWWVDLPALVQYLEGHSQYTLPASLWEQKLLEFLKASLRPRRGLTPASSWALTLAKEFARQRSLWPDEASSAERAFLSKASGVALALAGDPAAASLTLRDLLLQGDLADPGQREGLRWSLSFCAEGQPDAVMDALGDLEAAIEEEEEPPCTLFGQGLPDPERTVVKAALMDFYGCVPVGAPRERLSGPLLGRVVARILRHYVSAGGAERAKADPPLGLSFIRSLSGLGRADHHQHHPAGVPQKPRLIHCLLLLVQPESKGGRLLSPVCKEAMAALRDLSRSPEALSREENLDLAEQSLSRFVALLPLEEETEEALFQETLAAFLDLMATLMGQVEAPAWLQQVFQLLGGYLASERQVERLLALRIGTRLLRARRKEEGPLPEAQWGPFVHFVGALAPLTFDTRGPVRREAAGCVGLLLSLQGLVVPRKLNGEEWRMRSIRRDLFCGDAGKGEAASRQLAKVVGWALPAEEVLPFLCSLVGQMGAVSPDCDRGALLWFEVAVQHWRMEPGDEFRQVRSLVGALCSRLEICEGPDPLRCLTGGLCVLVERYPGPTCLSLLQCKGLPGRAFSTCSGDPFLDGLLRRFLPPLNQPSGIFRDLSLSFCIELMEHLMEHRPEVVTPLLQGWLREAKEGGLTPHATAFQGLENVAEATAMAEVKTDPVVLESLLAELPHYLSSPSEEVQWEACKLAGILLENMDTLCSETLDLEPLSQALRALTRDSGLGPALTAAAEEAQSRCLGRQASSRRRSFLGRIFTWRRKGGQRGGARP